MYLKVVFLLMLSTIIVCEAVEQNLEARGKKKKLALYVWFADMVIKKFFILKLIYAFVLWAIIHKAGYFLSWFISYLKDKKQEYHHDHHEDHDHYPHYEYGHYYEYGPPHQSYGPPSYGPQYSSGPYRKEAWSNGN